MNRRRFLLQFVVPMGTLAGVAACSGLRAAQPSPAPTAAPTLPAQPATVSPLTPTVPTALATAQPPTTARRPGLGAGPGASGRVGQGPGRGPNCARTSIGLTPLNDLGTGTYKGHQGGLYPNGSNQPPAAYLSQGVAHAKAVQPLNASGQPDPSGKMVLLSIGMSNATDEYSEFKREADANPRKNPKLTIVDGAIPSFDAVRTTAPQSPYWSDVDQRIGAAGVAAPQVQAVWILEAIAQPRAPFPNSTQRLQHLLETILTDLTQRFANLRLVYLSSRIYAGYATSTLNPEPYAYESGFAVKWVVQDAIDGKISGPWVGWGPYTWADGTTARSDGLTWDCSDLLQDGTHPSASGDRKVAGLMLTFFTSDPTATPWFIG